MSGLRSLLRLDEKVAAEGRRLSRLGGPPMRWLTPLTLLAAVLFHAAILLVPAVKTTATYPQVSAVPDFPLVWRPVAAIPPIPPPVSVPLLPVMHAPGDSTRHDADVVLPITPLASRPIRVLTFEPVPEPDPELTLTRISAEVEALLPPPDELPPSQDVGPASGGVASSESILVERVEPVYPVAARSLNATGQVTLRVAILPDGSIAGAVVTGCSRPGVGFEAAALAAVRKWRYAPVPDQQGSRDVDVSVRFKQPGRP